MIAFLPNLSGPDGILILLVVLLLTGAKKSDERNGGRNQELRWMDAGERSEFKIDWPMITLLFINLILATAILLFGKA